MDAPVERDVKLQKASADLLADIHTSLPTFLRKPSSPSNCIGRLEPFQEWPQLLDPHLSALLSFLDTAFVDILVCRGARAWQESSKVTTDGPSATIPLHRAICKILYVFCKIRGEKVISRFFNNEPRILEPMLLAFEAGEICPEVTTDSYSETKMQLVWEERYVMLLWLSQLLLAPFDLVSISSITPEDDEDGVAVTGLKLPPGLPGISRRILPMCLRYLAAPSKEAQSAKSLLVRLVLRPDMRRLHLLDALVRWALSTLRIKEALPSEKVDTFQLLGVLSFLCGLLASADHDVIGPFILPIFNVAHEIIQNKSPQHLSMTSSATARKLLIKLYRGVTLFLIQTPREKLTGVSMETSSEILEDVIEHLLNAMADKDTPVRYATSKALSMITAKLDPHLAAEVVEAIVGSLAEDVLYEDEMTRRRLTLSEVRAALAESKVDPRQMWSRAAFLGSTKSDSAQTVQMNRLLTAVNALRWHGLTLALAQLLYHRSAPSHKLPEIINCLLLSLAFEQRSPTGSSVGTNVRDAACFGIWALSRRYSTGELLAIETSSIPAANKHSGWLSVPQVLATELVVAASIDLAGNIRRGASAALQELIGRHPDTVIAGISVVQSVDYHAVALRSRAITEVAIKVSEFDEVYRAALFDALLGWRGAAAVDTSARRTAAIGVGILYGLPTSNSNALNRKPPLGWNDSVGMILDKLRRYKKDEDMEKQHGLLLCIASITTTMTGDERAASISWLLGKIDKLKISGILWQGERMASVIEAECTIVASQLSLIGKSVKHRSIFAAEISTNIKQFSDPIAAALTRQEPMVIKAASAAAVELLRILPAKNRSPLLESWLALARNAIGSPASVTGVSDRPIGLLTALGNIFSVLSPDDMGTSSFPNQIHIMDTLSHHGAHGRDMETRVAAMHSLTTGVLSASVLAETLVSDTSGYYRRGLRSAINEIIICLDDYTIDSRGDIGSWIRLQSIEAVHAGLRNKLFLHSASLKTPLRESETALFSRIARLASEKLDKVRHHASICLAEILSQLSQYGSPTPEFDPTDTSSTTHFSNLLSLLHPPVLSGFHLPLLSGYVTSTGAASESVLQASRLALATFCEALPLQPTPSQFSQTSLLTALTSLLNTHQAIDRVLVPLLETIAFLFESGVIPTHLPSHPDHFSWPTFFTLIQKSHYKSTNLTKLTTCVKLYAGLLDVSEIRPEVTRKLLTMLKHPFPKVRNAVADTLFCVGIEDNDQTRDRTTEVLKHGEWGTSVAGLKDAVEELRSLMVTA